MNMNQIKFTESEHPAAVHQQDINACVHHIRDAVVDYLESDILTAGEFVNAIKTALGDSLQHHQSRANLLKDAESLLTQNITRTSFRLDELQE